jgi:hypothetical protein
LNNKVLSLHSCVTTPDFGASTVLSDDPWDYVNLWLKRSPNKQAIFYWEQAHEFYNASISLSNISSPLTSYYSMLNATKALLLVKNIQFADLHGVSGEVINSKKHLHSEVVFFKQQGILSNLCSYLGENITNKEKYSLYQIFYNLPFLHRAFTLTYQSAKDLFIPIKQAMFVRKDDSNEAWFSMELDGRYVTPRTHKILPVGYEVDKGVIDKYIVRKKQRFKLEANGKLNIDKLIPYHKSVRSDVFPIFAPTNRWYLRKNLTSAAKLDKSQMPLMFAAMHKLSELARYDPIRLAKHLENQQNWIIVEFLKMAPAQFINNIASEITGKEFVKPFASRME